MRPTRRPISIALALSCLALLGACSSERTTATGGSGGSSEDGRGGGRGLVSLELASALQPFGSCDDLLGHLKSEAAERVTAYGLPGVGYGGGIYYGVPEGAMADASKRASPPTTAAALPSSIDQTAAGSGAAPDGGPTFSGTNTVEQGIDEGDTVKTDGTHLYLLDSATATLRVVAANDGQPTETGRLAFPGYPAQLVRVGSTLLVTGTPDDTITDGSGGSGGPGGTGKSIMPVWTGNRSVVWQVDVADPAKPTLVRQLVVDGTIATIRMTGTVARLVVQSPPDDLGFVSPTNPAGEARALQTNKEVIAASTIEDWLGGYRLLDADGGQLGDGRLAACDQVRRPKEFHGFTVTSVLSVDVAKGLSEPNAAAVVADSQQVYASADNLYVAIGAWQDPIAIPVDGAASGDEPTSSDDQRDRDEATTAIHRFTFDGDRADYTATGEVTGSLMNDFSMSEHDGVLRVATTAGAPWMWGSGPDSESFVTTLKAEGDELRQVGRVGELGKGERIYAVRFIGPNGYVVTFRQTDPLYVLDLADPATPKVTGELKINGYSAYLHPLSDGRLLGVGRDADDNGRTTGAQVSIFDVSDPTAPTRTAVYTLADSSTNAEYDYKAFLYWAPEQLVLLPVSSWGQDGSVFSGAIGLDIGETITERGRITSAPVEPTCTMPYPMPAIAEDGEGGGAGIEPAPATTIPAATSPMPCPTWAPPIERTVIIDGSVYAIASGNVQAADLETLTAQGQVTFS